MTRDRFKSELSIRGGQFDFQTDRHEGMIGINPSSIVIWVDDISADGDEPKYIGEFKDVDELLEEFKVDGESFATNVLPKIIKLNMLLT